MPSPHISRTVKSLHGGKRDDEADVPEMGVPSADAVLPMIDKAMTVQLSYPVMFDAFDDWLVDICTRERLCRAMKGDKMFTCIMQMPPRIFGTAKGKCSVASALQVTFAVIGTRIEPVVMTRNCPRAISVGMRIVRQGRGDPWLSGGTLANFAEFGSAPAMRRVALHRGTG